MRNIRRGNTKPKNETTTNKNPKQKHKINALREPRANNTNRNYIVNYIICNVCSTLLATGKHKGQKEKQQNEKKELLHSHLMQNTCAESSSRPSTEHREHTTSSNNMVIHECMEMKLLFDVP